jgi:biopolymer transport protein ExbD
VIAFPYHEELSPCASACSYRRTSRQAGTFRFTPGSDSSMRPSGSYRSGIFEWRPSPASRQPTFNTPVVAYAMAAIWLVAFSALAPLLLGRFHFRRGIPVRLVHIGVVQTSGGLDGAGLLVYVDSHGHLYLNSKPVTGADLPQALEDEFATRPDWSVYVEGDSNAVYRDVVHAMDLVRSAQGQVIVLTPNMRAASKKRRSK